MSDYLFTSTKQPSGRLSKLIKSIYLNSAPECTEFHGTWGSLAVSDSRYHGFKPFENEQHICIVIGAPVLYFRDNNFLTQADANLATQAIYTRWKQQEMSWADDLSGPFTVLLIDKQACSISVVTDLMAFIPVYSYLHERQLALGTHVDALAKATNKSHQLDLVSLADFILNDVITFPYTAYTHLRQEEPGSITTIDDKYKKSVSTYWQPTEKKAFNNLDEASLALRRGIKKYIDTVTKNMSHIAQFISAGEDSRALSGLLPQEKPRDAYIFLDHMNREGKIAQKVAKAYGANFIVGYRDPLHYLQIMPEASTLVGLGHQYSHAHSLRFDKKFNLEQYEAVFGGYLSDSLLKGAYVPKLKGSERFPFLPDMTVNRSPVNNIPDQLSQHINSDLKQAIAKRREKHYNSIKKIRPFSANEWFVLYPASMRTAIPNFYSTRRLFKSYEPFLSNEVVKIAAYVPTSWKLNRKLFHKAMQPFLKKSQWILHADGRLPYYPWWVNSPLQASIWLIRQVAKKTLKKRKNEGPWCDWNTIIKSREWKKNINEHNDIKTMNGILKSEISYIDLINSSIMKEHQKINQLQCLYQIKKQN